MRRVYFLFLSISCIIGFIILSPNIASAQFDQISIPNITPYWIKRQAYSTSTALILSKGKGAQGAQDSSNPLTKNLATSIPSAAGGISIILGSLFTWMQVRKKNKIFKTYMKQIAQITDSYHLDIKEHPKTQKKAQLTLKEDFIRLQEDADLAAADKKIDDGQRTTIANTIERKQREILNTA